MGRVNARPTVFDLAEKSKIEIVEKVEDATVVVALNSQNVDESKYKYISVKELSLDF